MCTSTQSLARSAIAAVCGAVFSLGAAAQGTVIDFSSARGTGMNQQDVLMENVRVLTSVPNPFQPGTSTTVTNTYNVTFRFDPTSLHLVPIGIQTTDGIGCAQAQVTVYDAVRGAAAPLANASVTIGSRTTTTDAQGVATFSQLPEGLTSLSAAASNYTSASQTAVLQCNVPNQVAVALSPAGGTQGGLGSGQFRTILTWGENPRDLDSHMTGPAADGSRWHVYYSAKTAGGQCALDVDDTSSLGPETVTCPPTDTTGSLQPGVYRYSVHHFSGSENIGNSGANVRLEFGNGQTYNFTPPAGTYVGSRDVWTVFELTLHADGTSNVAPVNAVMAGVSAGSVTSEQPIAPGTGFGQTESPITFHNLVK
jgi:hypothetical protein